MQVDEPQPSRRWRRWREFWRGFGNWRGFSNLRIMQTDDWEDPYWRTRENRWLGKMWGPIPVQMILWLVPLSFLILYSKCD